MHNTGTNWMSCVGCVGANYTVSTKPAAKKRCAAFSEELLSAFHIATT